MYSQQRTVTANASFPVTIFFNFLQPQNIDYRTKTTLKVQVKWNYYVNYDIKVLIPKHLWNTTGDVTRAWDVNSGNGIGL